MKRSDFVQECLDNLVVEPPVQATDRKSVVNRLRELERYKPKYELLPIGPDGSSDARLLFGRYRGELLSDLCRREPGYVGWLLRQDFPKEFLELILKRKVLAR